MPGLIKWKYFGKKPFRIRGGRKIVKPNETFDAAESEIPQAFRDLIVPVKPLASEPPVEVIDSGYQLRHRAGNWYDILDAQGKVVNEKALRQDEARRMLEALAPGEPVKEAVSEPENPAPAPAGASGQ